MIDIKKARAASNRLLNGMTVELRIVNDDLIYGYEGLSFSGCNIWSYSTKLQQGYLSFTDNEELAYDIVYDPLNYHEFDKVPDYTQTAYKEFLANYAVQKETKNLPEEYRGNYHRVKINEKDLADVFVIGENFIVIRNPEEVRYETMFINNHYHIRGKDNVQSTTVSLYEARDGNRYMLFDGTLYRKINA
jgi:hypothetical protein